MFIEGILLGIGFAIGLVLAILTLGIIGFILAIIIGGLADRY